MTKLETGRKLDDELITGNVLAAIDVLESYLDALMIVYRQNLYENTWSHEMQEHYVRCKRVLEELRRWELCPHVLG